MGIKIFKNNNNLTPNDDDLYGALKMQFWLNTILLVVLRTFVLDDCRLKTTLSSLLSGWADLSINHICQQSYFFVKVECRTSHWGKCEQAPVDIKYSIVYIFYVWRQVWPQLLCVYLLLGLYQIPALARIRRFFQIQQKSGSCKNSAGARYFCRIFKNTQK